MIYCLQEQEDASARAEEEKRAKEKRKQQQQRHRHHKRSNRPASAQKVTSSPKKSKTAHSPASPGPVSKKADKMETSPPPPSHSTVAGYSKKSSRCSTANKSVNAGQECGSRPISSTSLHSSNKKGSCHNTTTTAEQSRVCSSNGETETITVSRCSKCRSVISSQPHAQELLRSASTARSSAGGGGRTRSTKSATSVQSGSTRVSSTLASGSGRSVGKRAELKAEAVRKDLHQ